MATSFSVGDIRVDRVVESEGPFMPASTMFPSLDPHMLERERASLEGMGALVVGTQMLVLAVQSYVVRTPRHTILIDTCVGNDKPRSFKPEWHMQTGHAYMQALAATGLGVADIDIVLCTHLHVDHVGWNTRRDGDRWVPTFPNARYLFGAREYAHWDASHRETPNPVFADSVSPVVEAGQVDFVASDHAIDDHVRLVPTPGHTPGHVAAVLGRHRDEAMITGDLIHSPLQVTCPELSPTFDHDPAGAAVTRRLALETMCAERMLCCTAHFPSPSVFRIGRAGEAFRCEAA